MSCKRAKIQTNLPNVEDGAGKGRCVLREYTDKEATKERCMETKTTKWIKGANEEETRKDFIGDLFYRQKLEKQKLLWTMKKTGKMKGKTMTKREAKEIAGYENIRG